MGNRGKPLFNNQLSKNILPVIVGIIILLSLLPVQAGIQTDNVSTEDKNVSQTGIKKASPEILQSSQRLGSERVVEHPKRSESVENTGNQESSKQQEMTTLNSMTPDQMNTDATVPLSEALDTN